MPSHLLDKLLLLLLLLRGLLLHGGHELLRRDHLALRHRLKGPLIERRVVGLKLGGMSVCR